MNPVEGVVVSASDSGTIDTTDISGAYSLDSLDVGFYDITFYHQDYYDTSVTGIQVIADDTTDLDMVMREIPGTMLGTVTDMDSQPVESVYVEISTVTIFTADGDKDHLAIADGTEGNGKFENDLILEVIDSVYTDSNGFYACQLPAGTYDVLFSHADYNDTTCADIVVTPGDVTVLNVQLPLAGCEYVIGDANGSGGYNGLDITYGVNFFKYGSPEPQCPYGSCPIAPCDAFFYCGDVNGSCNYNGLDITYGVNYFKFGSPGPTPCGDCPPVGGIVTVQKEQGRIIPSKK
jgi:hypothetical protein